MRYMGRSRLDWRGHLGSAVTRRLGWVTERTLRKCGYAVNRKMRLVYVIL